jgi:tRNA (guanine37-N1)-methyltransferase
MKFSVITIFPEMIRHFLGFGLLQKALAKGLLTVDVHDLREFSNDRHRKVDDRPFGGGPGMVMMPDPLFRAIEAVRGQDQGPVILLSAYGKVLDQEKVKELAALPNIILVCGRYEGVDQRFIDTLVDQEISIGEFVLMGGELAAAVVLECVSRMIPGVIGNPDSVTGDSFFYEGQFAFPQFTQPREFRGMAVPEVLLSGNHAEIQEWRQKNQKRRK